MQKQQYPDGNNLTGYMHNTLGADRRPFNCEQQLLELSAQRRLDLSGDSERKRGDASVQHGRRYDMEFIIANL